jgi:hypothetical protein
MLKSTLDHKWLVEDGIYLTNNLYFGLGSSYFCGHGCQCCYIRDELKALRKKTDLIYNNDLKVMEKAWEEVYSFFTDVAADEDPYFFRINHPNEWEWYTKNSERISYGTTDNGIFRIGRLPLKFRSMSEISLSTSWCERVGADRIIPALEKLMPIEKIKFIVDTEYYPVDIIKWAMNEKMPMVVHKTNFVTGKEIQFDTSGFDIVQDNDWVAGKQENDLVKIHINSDVILYYDSFYFSNNIGEDAYFKLSPEGFDYRGYLAAQLQGKIDAYKKFAEYDTDYRDYFLNTLRYKVNHDYNFIPNYMIDWNVRYYHRMRELGWKATKYGLIYPSDKVIPIVEVR